MRRVLLIADLEGITGIERVEQLVLGAPGYPAAARRMTEEVARVVRLLREHGVEHVRISDAHHSGADGNLDGAALPDGCELVFDVVDMYGGRLLDDVDAVLAVGMHALGASAGFGAHTVSVNTEWTLGGELLTESRVVQLLAAERGVPFWFTAGCDVLERQVPAGMHFVRTKRSLSRGEATSLPVDAVEQSFRQRIATTKPKLAERPLLAPLQVRFQKRLEAERAEGGALRAATVRELPAMPSFHAQFLAACRMIETSAEAMLSRIEGAPGTMAFSVNASRILLDGWD